ncbi:MAG TPA: N-acetylmuramoyl-L-alanine amidase-like domain-containing protein [Bdellovibrionota bacterium]|nr:N-acetylmuramoyl-L-alanine amidase-like domain-containing protein [Bdellovibrionota bacterium]
MRALLALAAISALVSIPADAGFDLARHAAQNYGKTVAERVDRVSALFVGEPYVLDPLGEGPAGEFDRDPLFRFDEFDCTTFVETVMALSLSSSQGEFEALLNRIRYKGGKPAFEARNHFPDADWRPHLLSLGLVKDVTKEVAGELQVREAHARIDRKQWYASLGADRIHVPGAGASQARALLEKLHQRGTGLGVERSVIPYIPFDEFFEHPDNGYVVPKDVLARIPSGTIFSIVRTRFHASDKVGTELSVWHQGLLIRKNGQLIVRHATFLGAGRVMETSAVDFLLSEYLRKINVGSRDHGINLLQITGPVAR